MHKRIRGYVEVIIGSVTKAGMRISVERRFADAESEAAYWRNHLINARMSRPDSRAHMVEFTDRNNGAVVLVHPSKVVAIIVYGGDS